MKSIILVTAFFAGTLQAHAGPFVSGGMPGAIRCTDANKEYEMKLIWLGTQVSVEGTKLSEGNVQQLNHTCVVRKSIIAGAATMTLEFTCTSATQEAIHIYKNHDVHEYSGQVLARTQNGVVRPIALDCVRTTP